MVSYVVEAWFGFLAGYSMVLMSRLRIVDSDWVQAWQLALVLSRHAKVSPKIPYWPIFAFMFRFPQ